MNKSFKDFLGYQFLFFIIDQNSANTSSGLGSRSALISPQVDTPRVMLMGGKQRTTLFMGFGREEKTSQQQSQGKEKKGKKGKGKKK